MVTSSLLLTWYLVLLLDAALAAGGLLTAWYFMRQWNTPSPAPSPATKESAAHGRHANRVSTQVRNR